MTFRRDPATGRLRPASCVAASPVHGCRRVRGIRTARSITLSADGRFAYVAAIDEAVGVFRRLPAGGLRQLRGRAGCITNARRNPSCAPARGLFGPHRVTLSPDGRFAYLASKRRAGAGGALDVFRRDPRSGRLRQLAGAAGCLTEGGPAPGCGGARAVEGGHQVLLDRGGRTLIVSSDRGAGLAVFRRDARTGRVQQLRGARGCLGSLPWRGCAFARRTNSVHYTVLSQDGRFGYAAGENTSAVIVLRRRG